MVTTTTTAGASRVAAGSFCLHAVAITPAGLMELIRSYFSINVGLPQKHGGSAPALIVSRPAQRSLTLRPARSPSRLATLCTRGFSGLVASTAALIATGWSETVPGRDFHPQWTRASTAHEKCGLGSAYGFLQGAWPFGAVEAVWSLVAGRRWWQTIGQARPD